MKALWKWLLIGFLFILGSVLGSPDSGAGELPGTLDAWLETIASVGKEAQGHPEAQAAWIQVVRHATPADLPTILARIDPNQPLASNWLLLAAQAIWEHSTQSGKPVPWEFLLQVYQDRTFAPRARFLVYQWLVEARAEEKPKLLAQALDDPSLDIRREAIELFLAQAQKAEQAGQTQKAVANYHQALSAARDPDQIETIAKALRRLGESVDLARHFGFVRQWKVIGPFDNTDGRGFATPYPPETEWKPQAEYPGKHGPVRWLDHTTKDDYGVVDFNKVLGQHKDVVGYAAAELPLRTAREVQIRIGTPNALKLWVNGKLVAAHDVYHSGYQIDQYILTVPLQAGKNLLLVKLCQNNIQEDWARFWQFQLRICDAQGTAILPDPITEQEKTGQEKDPSARNLLPCTPTSPANTIRKDSHPTFSFSFVAASSAIPVNTIRKDSHLTSSGNLRPQGPFPLKTAGEQPSWDGRRSYGTDAPFTSEAEDSLVGTPASFSSAGGNPNRAKSPEPKKPIGPLVNTDGESVPSRANPPEPEKPVGPWPQFRGPGGNPIHLGIGPPVQFGPEKNLAWKASLPGRGPSSPIVVGDRVIVTASSGPRQDRLHLLCFDAQTGQRLWHRWFWATGSTLCNPFAAVAAPTPASNGQEVVAFYSSNDLACFDLDGNLCWMRGLGYEHPLTRNDVGMASSPLLVADRVAVQCETFGDSFAAAFRLANGQTLWQVPRAPTSMWASPVVYPKPNRKGNWILMHSRLALTALDALTGQEAWRYEVGCHSMASSLVVGDRILLPGGGMQCLRWNAQSGQAELLWRQNRLICGAPSPAVLDEKIYTIRDPGILICGNLADGRILWQLRLQGPIWATPVMAGGHLYAINHGGLVQVVQLPQGNTKEPGQVVHTCQLDQGILATPALADGAIYFRSDRSLWKFASSPSGPSSGQGLSAQTPCAAGSLTRPCSAPSHRNREQKSIQSPKQGREQDLRKIGSYPTE